MKRLAARTKPDGTRHLVGRKHILYFQTFTDAHDEIRRICNYFTVYCYSYITYAALWILKSKIYPNYFRIVTCTVILLFMI